jgi:hypothetical protein
LYVGFEVLTAVVMKSHLRTETDKVSAVLCSLVFWKMDKVQKSSNLKVSEALCSLEFWKMDKVQKSGNLKCYPRSPEPFRNYEGESVNRSQMEVKQL